MGEQDELREIRAILTELRDMERASLELQRRQEQRVERSVQTQELAVARQRTALRVALVLTVLLVVVVVPALFWLLKQL
jgi:cell division septal protein FtsQ